MDNFHFVQVKPKIEQKEVSLIKEVIFKRAREKAQQMSDKSSEHYTSDAQNDVMDIASASFKSNEFNPFNKFKESMGLNPTKAEPATEQVAEKANPSQELSPRFKPLKHNVQSVSNANYSNSVKDETMAVASSQFRHNLDLTTSLKFLNAQAAIQMAKYAHSKINYMG